MNEEKPLGHVPGEDPRFAKLEANMVGNNDPELAAKIAKANAAVEDVASILSGVFKHKVQPATAQAAAPELPSGGTGNALGAEGLDLDLGNGSGNNPPPPSPPPSGGGNNGESSWGKIRKELGTPVGRIMLGLLGAFITSVTISHLLVGGNNLEKITNLAEKNIEQTRAETDKIRAETEKLRVEKSLAQTPASQKSSGSKLLVTKEMRAELKKSGKPLPGGYGSYELEFLEDTATIFRQGAPRPKRIDGLYIISSPEADKRYCQTYDPLHEESIYSLNGCADFFLNAPQEFNVWHVGKKNIIIHY